MDINLLAVKIQYEQKSSAFPDPEFIHAKTQGGGVDSQNGGSAFGSADAPAGGVENFQDMLFFNGFQRVETIGGICRSRFS